MVIDEDENKLAHKSAFKLNYKRWTHLFWWKQNIRASDISRGRGPAKFPKNAKYREIRQKYFQIHVGKTYLILILAIRPVLFTPKASVHVGLKGGTLELYYHNI